MLSRTFLILGLLVVVATATWSFAQRATSPQRITPDGVLPAKDCIAFLSADGLGPHDKAWRESAAYDALVKSGLVSSLQKYIRDLLSTQGLADADADRTFTSILEQGIANGITIAVYFSESNPNNVPDVLLAFSDGQRMLDRVTEGYELLFYRDVLPSEFEAYDDGDRYVLGDGDESLTVWVDNDIFYVTGPTWMADSIGSRLEADGPPVSSHKHYLTDNAVRSFVDIETVMAKVSDLVGEGPRGQSVSELASLIGLGGLQAWVGEASFRDREVVTHSELRIDPDNLGLFDTSDVTPLTLSDLPPLPQGVAAFSFNRCDLLACYDDLIGRAKAVYKEVKEEGDQESVDDLIAQAETELGFPVRDLVAGFGDVIGAFDQFDGGILAPPVVFVASVRDRSLLKRVADSLVERGMENAEENITLTRAEEDGYDRITISTGTPISLSLGLSDEWAVVTMTPSYLADFYKRVQGDASHWTPDEDVVERVPAINEPFLGLAYVDTAATWKSGLNLLPMAFGGISQAMGGSVPLPRLPRARSITRPMFPNVSVTTATEAGLETNSSSSTFAFGNVASSGMTKGVFFTSIGAAILLPAVQQAREAANRAPSKEDSN